MAVTSVTAVLSTVLAPTPRLAAQDGEPSTTKGHLPGGTAVTGGVGSTVVDDGVRLDGTVAIGEGPPVEGTTPMYVLGVSGSTNNAGNCGAGDQNGNGDSDRILDCQIAAAPALNQIAIEAGTVAEVGAAVFGTNAARADVGPADRIQLLTGPDMGANGRSMREIDEVLTSMLVGEVRDFTRRRVGTATNFQAGLVAVCNACG